MKNAHSGRSPWKGAVAGLIAGVVASWMVDQFQHLLLSMPAGKRSATPGDESTKSGAAVRTQIWPMMKLKTTLLRKQHLRFQRVSLVTSPRPGKKAIAGPVVHYVVGATAGLADGVAAEFLPQVTAG
jgi:hypothetical protein